MSKARYIEAKQRWAEKQKARGVTARAVPSQDRLPPGQKLTDGFPVLDLGVQPAIEPADWTLTLDGLVEKPAKLDWAAFHALPQVEDVSDFHCVTTWSKYDCRWGGVAFTTLYELAQPKPEAQTRLAFYLAACHNATIESLREGEALARKLGYKGGEGGADSKGIGLARPQDVLTW